MKELTELITEYILWWFCVYTLAKLVVYIYQRDLLDGNTAESHLLDGTFRFHFARWDPMNHATSHIIIGDRFLIVIPAL